MAAKIDPQTLGTTWRPGASVLLEVPPLDLTTSTARPRRRGELRRITAEARRSQVLTLLAENHRLTLMAENQMLLLTERQRLKQHPKQQQDDLMMPVVDLLQPNPASEIAARLSAIAPYSLRGLVGRIRTRLCSRSAEHSCS